ncbi:rhodanese-like domain-containing protein [Novipirellula herctigrandis]|uniref:rhodanese-like domain-containing protein n=1 Tax=Novipirellula herctigrandis TaxID=2527986 RepID=UPI003AF3FA45
MKTVTVNELANREANGGVELIDVRTPVEFRSLHAECARNHPLDSLDPHAIMGSRTMNTDDPLYVICKSGGRSLKGCKKFLDAGFTNVINVEGGTSAWDRAGLAVVRGKKSMSLERQTRITVGLIILVSGILALTVHPIFAGLAALMGAGLAFAGITDSCMMGMMLARMPWNQVGTETQACAVE